MLGPTVSRPLCGAYDQIVIAVRQLGVCWCGVLSLTTGRVCHLEFLLVLANAVILGSESRETRDHILLPHIRDFPFRRLLRLSCYNVSANRIEVFQQHTYCVLGRFCALNGSLPWISAFNLLKLHCMYQNPSN
jgi:hypothetical protein